MGEATAPIDFGSFTMSVNGTEISFNLDDLQELEADELTGLIARWGHVKAEAQCELMRVDNSYRSFRADCGVAMLAKDAKLAEWKVKQIIEDHPTFGQMKEGLALATRNLMLADAVLTALTSRAHMEEPS